ncbi:5349_t:CDS:2, partial [Gigaspora margarita]
MVKTIKNKKEIIRSSLNLIWKATKGEVKEIFFNEPSRLATVFLSDGTNDTENLNLDSDLSSQVDELMLDAQTNQTNENDILNLEENQRTEDSHINNYFKTSKRK